MVAHVLAVVAVVAAVFGFASWQPAKPALGSKLDAVGLVCSTVEAQVTARAERGGRAERGAHTERGGRTRPEDEARALREADEEKADVGPRSPLPVQSTRARAEGGQEPRLFAADEAAAVPANHVALEHAGAIVHGRRHRASWSSLLECAPESVGRRAANPARGPPVG